jgi:hypothetical protein
MHTSDRRWIDATERASAEQGRESDQRLEALSMNQKIVAGLFALFLAVPGAARALPVLATPYNDVSASASGAMVGTYADSCGGPTVSGTTTVSTSCEAAGIPIAPFGSWATAIAGLGAVHIATYAGGSAFDINALSSSANASATATDYFAVSGPANSTGHLYGSVVIHGALAAVTSGAPAAAAGQSGYSIQTSVGSLDGGILAANNGTSTQTNIDGGVLPADIVLTFGPDGWAPVTFSIYAQLQSNGSASAYRECSTCELFDGTYSTGANFVGTIYWGGITSVTVDDVPLTDFEVVSASGADYRFATVPEPSASLLVLAGLTTICAHVRMLRRSALPSR